MNDSYCLDLDKKEFHRVHTAGAPPAPRRGCIGFFDPERDVFFVFGGYTDQPGILDETLYYLDCAAEPFTWKTQPFGRGHTLSLIRGGNRQVVFADQDASPIPRTTSSTIIAGMLVQSTSIALALLFGSPQH